MESLIELYKIGNGPSSSHTMGPAKAAKIFKEKNQNANKFIVTLYGSLAATGKGHLTDQILYHTLGTSKTTIIFAYNETFEYHPNGLKLEAYLNNAKLDEWLVFSVGGGSLKNLNEPRDTFTKEVYPHKSMEAIIEYCKKKKIDLYEYVLKYEKEEVIIPYLESIYNVMENAINRGLYTSGILPGGLNVEKKAASFYQEYLKNPSLDSLVYAYALAVAEENASGGIIVTAPTCGASAVVPAVLFAEKTLNKRTKNEIIKALAVGGIIGNLVKTNGSISGAEVGCQGEVGVACAMAASIIAYLNNGTLREIEYAAEIGLEHHLGMTCDPINGLVQIPCIERNAIAAMKAYNCARYSILTKGIHQIKLDDAIEVMEKTGRDLKADYRETSLGGLAYQNGNNHGNKK